MAQFKYTLPSGAEFQLDAPPGTTQAQADVIFYGQVAAGTFVGYEPGDTLTSADIALANFGLSRLERGTAGVDEQTLLAITAGLPVVVDLPQTVTSAPVENPVDIASYVQVTSNPSQGLLDQGPNDIGGLSRPQVQALMAASVVQPATELSNIGVGKYGFNTAQLIRTGYIKAQMESESPVDPTTQTNSAGFTQFMRSPTPWTGKNGVASVDDILTNESLQNNIQELLMNQSYNTLVKEGLITPPRSAVTKSAAKPGQVYDNTGIMVTSTAIALRTASAAANSSVPGVVTGNTVPEIAQLGPVAEAVLQAGQGSLSSGAVNFTGGQVTGLATAAAAGAAAILSSRVTGDIGALISNASKYGPALTTAWAKGSNLLSGTSTADLSALAKTGIANLAGGAQNLASGLQAQLSSVIAGPTGAAMAALGKASQLAASIGSQIPGLVSKVEKAPAFLNTVDRKTVDAAVTRVIGSAKIASPTFEIPSIASLGAAADINKAKSILAQAGASAQALGNQAVAIVGQAQGIANNLTSQAQGVASNLTSQAQGIGRNFFG